MKYFNPLPSSEGRQLTERIENLRNDNFNPLPSSEGRQPSGIHSDSRGYFNPLPSSEGRLFLLIPFENDSILQSTSLIRGKTDCRFQFCFSGRTSIHFPHPREDRVSRFIRLSTRHFNPLPSSEGRQSRRSYGA